MRQTALAEGDALPATPLCGGEKVYTIPVDVPVQHRPSFLYQPPVLRAPNAGGRVDTKLETDFDSQVMDHLPLFQTGVGDNNEHVHVRVGGSLTTGSGTKEYSGHQLPIKPLAYPADEFRCHLLLFLGQVLEKAFLFRCHSAPD